MVRIYCDICERSTTETIDDLFKSRKFIMLDANDGEKIEGIHIMCRMQENILLHHGKPRNSTNTGA